MDTTSIDHADLTIVKRILAGNRQAYEQIIERYKGPVFNLAYRMTGSYDDAADLSQEIFIRAFRNLKKFDQRKRFFTWLYTIALNHIRNHQAKGRRLSEIVDNGISIENIADVVSEDNSEQLLIKKEDAELITENLHTLPRELREALVLRYFQAFSFDEIAEISGSSLSAVKMRVYRGLEQLRVMIQTAKK
ncbi:MAG: RNA polymerase sigma factor [Deltaproteobacteria bacterium]|nr:RNA polymerase sigma factor [Deltaproteobacteria bacterium]